jgi:glycosyltransferase involved in cell wall biosynthesis
MSKNKKPRIALLGKGTLDARGLGIPTMIDLCDRLSADFEITFYSFLPIDDSKVPAGVAVRVPVKVRLPGRIKYFLIALRCLIDHIRNPFLLFFAVSTYPAGLWTVRLAKLVNRPSVVQLIATEAGTADDVNIGTLSIPWQKKIALEVCKKADHVVLIADYQIEFAKKNLITKKEVVVLPLRINPRKFFRLHRSMSMPIQFVQIGFFSLIKDQHTLFRTFALVAEQIDCHLTVIGDGFDNDEVRQLVNSLKIEKNVTFTGYIRNDDLPEKLKGMHILLHTAIFETGCGVIQEAMASGIVVAGTKVGILYDIGEQFAVMAPVRRPELLAKEIIDLVNNPNRYKTLADTAHDFIATYDCVWAYKNYRRFIHKVITPTDQT